ncbi:hypothetical protein PHYBOEH_005936 [Phytophthora boehmeriae]|uniref:Cationic amino acid transporter C-terminal domain-containing protein n=1 Tax=Phytophthora boehmeriae TaxID=109152 RepID=A0A8T1WPY9_9STRA|nr:hypothetical protein PHYBOEH_005936 [Phytophthora boehmeriae]
MGRFLDAVGRVKPLNRCEVGVNSLKKCLTLMDLISYGVGCSVGAGVYSLVGVGAQIAGPSISLSFLISGVACIFTSLTYSEFSARVPVTGSAYTFVYITFGELAAWLIGWNLTLGYGISAAGIARSWASYADLFLQHFGLHLPRFLVQVEIFGMMCSPMAAFLVVSCTFILLAGVHESAKFNAFVTSLNISVLLFVVIFGSTEVDAKYWEPFMPAGIHGVMTGAGVVFFAYLGFDMVACLAEEVHEPQRTLPKGIIGSLLISMTIYVGVSLVVTGMAPVDVLGKEVPLVNAFIFHDAPWAGRIVSFGSIFGLTTAAFTCLLGQPRIFYQMAKDGLLPPVFAKLNSRTHVPVTSTIFTGALVASIALVFDLDFLANVISCGTLQVFTFVNAGVLLLRMRPSLSGAGVVHRVIIFVIACFALSLSFVFDLPVSIQGFFAVVVVVSFVFIHRLGKLGDLTTSFQCPLVPLVPCVGILANVYMVSSIPGEGCSTLETPSHRRLTFMAACEKLMVTFDPQVQHSRRLKFVHIKPLLRFHGLEVDDASFRRWEQRLSLSSATDAATSAGPTVSVSEFIQGCQLWFTEAIIVEHARNLQQQQDARRLKHKKLLPLEYEPPQSPAREKQAPFDELARESGAAGTFSYEKYACHPPPRTSTLSASASAPALLHAKYCAHNQPDPFTLATATKLKNDNLEQRRKKKEADASARRTRKQTMEMARNFSSSVAMISRHVHNEEMRDHRTTELEKQIARVEETRQWSQLHEAHCKAIEQDAREQRTREVRAMKTLAEEELRFTRDFRVLREEAVRRNKPLFSMSSSTSTIIPAPPELLAARAAATTQQDRKRLARVEREHAEHMRSLQLLDYAYDRKRMLDEANQPRADSALVEVDVADEELPADRIVQLAGDELWRQIAQQQEQGDPDSLALLMPSSNSPPAALRYFGVSRPVSLPAFSSAVDRNL